MNAPARLSTHSPAPFTSIADRFTDDTGEHRMFHIFDAAGQEVAALYVALDDHREGDARLFVASPAMLAALRGIRETCPAEPDMNPRFQAAWDALEAAIALAEGRS